MTHNLLFLKAEEEIFQDKELCENLMLDKAFSLFANNESSLMYFTNILTNPLKDKDNIVYRREIFCDFVENPELLSLLERKFAQLAEQSPKNEFESINRFNYTNAGEAAYVSFVNSVRIKATALKASLNALKDIAISLEGIPVKSAGLKELFSRIREINDNEDFSELNDLCENISLMSPEHTFRIQVTFDETARIRNCDILRIYHKPQPSKNRHIFKFKSPKSNDISIPDYFNKQRYRCVCAAIKNISNLIVKTHQNIHSEFEPITKQLSFYRTALNYYKYMKNLDYPTVLPEIDENKTEIYDLHDILLCTMPNDVVPNDISFGASSRGILIRGANNSGKTVFLRSLGTAQLLAQAGLPVPATKAKFTICMGVYTQYAAFEREFEAGNNAGRFEQEVMLLSKFLETIKPHSLVLLNETFQTTSYDEGADGLYWILKSLEISGVRWMLATHLHKLFDLFGEKTAKYEVASDGSHKLLTYSPK